MTGLHIHRSERADALATRLAKLLSEEPSADPFAAEVVAVPARGVERWLSQQLSHHLGSRPDGGAAGRRAKDGVCANVRFPSPSSLVAQAVAAGSRVELTDDPWADGGVIWSLLGVIDECVAEPWCSVLAHHLGPVGTRPSRRPRGRLVAAQHVAGLYASYSAQRPRMLLDWSGGDDTDGAGAPLDGDVAWQAALWRRLRAVIVAPSPAERLEGACRALREEPGLVDLPPRLSLFGPTRLTVDQVDVLAALAEHRDVHLWLPHPSAALWSAIATPATPTSVTAGSTTSASTTSARPRRRNDPSAQLPRHQLLQSLGRDSREMQLLLAAAKGDGTDEHHPARETPPTLLGRLQGDLRADMSPPGVPLGASTDHRTPLDAGDHSVQVHACHGRGRQIEVLREVLLGLLAADQTLEPRDVLVMCPDIEAYAPFISGTFGLADAEKPPAHPGHRLRVRLADRSLRQTNPLLSMVAALLELADARVTASQVLDLAATGPVRRRFGLDEADLERMRDWVGSSGVRWGLDAAHRAPFHLQDVAQNTWQAGFDRVLLGVTMSDDELRWVGLGLPLDDVDSNDVDLAGRLAELVDRLAGVLDSLSGAQPLTAWLGALDGALEAITSVSERDGWQLAQARRELADLAASAADRADTVELSLADVRALLDDRLLQGRPTRAGFRTGDLTMCSMVPMRSVPHRVVCLLGLDDGVFPRTTGVDGDDILARDPCVGERDRRSEDRQLLLDAVLAAEEHLVVLYTGADERTNVVRPPAVPVGEILDVLDATMRLEGGRRARDQVLVRHPLQPFDERNFIPALLGTAAPFSFDKAALAGARAAASPRVARPPFLPSPLPPVAAGDTVDLASLIQFLEHPVKQFLRQRLGVAVPEEGDELDDALHAVLGPLSSWAVGDRWLQARLAGADIDGCLQAEWRRGELPPGALGTMLIEKIQLQAEPLLTAGAADRIASATSFDVVIPLPGGRLVAGTVTGVHGATLSRTVFSKLGPKHRLRAWVQLLALSAAVPSHQPWRAVTVGRHRKPGAARSVLVAPAPDAAAAALDALVALRDTGLREPLPLPPSTSCAYADVRMTGNDADSALEAAEKVWKSSFEDRDRYHTYVWGTTPDFADLLSQSAGPADQAAGSLEEERSRFGALACRLWWPVLTAETLETP